MADEKIINLQERTTVYATKTAPHHKEGEAVSCAPAVADKMILNGWATEKEGGEPKTKKGGV